MGAHTSKSSAMGAGGNATVTETTEYSDKYKPLEYGRITRYEANALYKAVKSGEVIAKRELVGELYDSANSNPGYRGAYSERYNQDSAYYDRIYQMTDAIVNGDYKKAQALIDKIENDSIERAGKKSRWAKYK